MDAQRRRLLSLSPHVLLSSMLPYVHIYLTTSRLTCLSSRSVLNWKIVSASSAARFACRCVCVCVCVLQARRFERFCIGCCKCDLQRDVRVVEGCGRLCLVCRYGSRLCVDGCGRLCVDTVHTC